MYFLDKPFGQGRVCGEIDGLHAAHEMPIVIIVAVVVSQHTAIVYGAPLPVDVRETVGNHLSVFEPDLLFEQRPSPFALEAMFLQLGRTNRLLFLTHGEIVSQVGLAESSLGGRDGAIA